MEAINSKTLACFLKSNSNDENHSFGKSFMRNRDHGLVLSLLLPILSLATPCLHAAELEVSLGSVLKKALEHSKINAPKGPVIVGAFIGNAQQDLSAGSGIRKMVVDKLKDRQVEIVRRGQHPVISGQYSYSGDSPAVLDLSLSIKDSNGDAVASFPERIDFALDEETIVNTVGPTAVLSPQDGGKEREAKINQAFKNPSVEIRDGKARAIGGKYGVGVLLKAGPCEIVDDQGVAFVKIEHGARYVLQLTNDSELDAVANVTIDGLDVFAFSEERGSPAGFLVPAGGNMIVNGWFVTRSRANTFVVGSFAESAAATELGEAADEGVIVVRFRMAWPKGQTPPPDEVPDDLPLRSGTAIGDPVEQQLKPVPRDVGKIREIISLRYGS